MRRPIPFNPLDRRNLAASAGEALLEADPEPLGQFQPFIGAGVYAIYYVGDFEPYRWIRDANIDGQWLAPIYVGKAVPSGSRKGGAVDATDTKALQERLRQHASSIRAAQTTLRIEHFWVRFLVVDDVWIPLVENLMISRFMPIWNTSIDGFGNHNTGKGRHEGECPRWDVLHPGRAWATKLKPRAETAETIAAEAQALLDARPRPQPGNLFRE